MGFECSTEACIDSRAPIVMYYNDLQVLIKNNVGATAATTRSKGYFVRDGGSGGGAPSAGAGATDAGALPTPSSAPPRPSSCAAITV